MPEAGSSEISTEQQEAHPLDALAQDVANRIGADGVPLPIEERQFEQPQLETGLHVESWVKSTVSEALKNDLDDPFSKKILEPFIRDPKSPEYNLEAYAHSKGVYEIVSAAARSYKDQLSFTDQDIRILEKAALPHDAGKQRPDIAALIKSDEEFRDEKKSVENAAKMKTIGEHAGYSADLIEEHFQDEPMVVALVRFHHQLQKNPSYSKEEEEAELQKLGITGELRKKFDLMQELFEAADKLDGMTRPRPYRDEDRQKQMTPDVVATNIFADFAAAGKDPETGMEAVHMVLALKFPTWEFSCNYVGSEQMSEDSKIVVHHRQIA